eukprot:TRINITY_DN4924_c0_g1_i3.p2 TRINITY_DN4924_c0_g1~~TRINITY_DN4924_c0_g1_i3.p2  ORF type:complete len:303 (+),score=76.91 TRINITY_DN4924_c0_g1_i3:296-1204(+)
MRFLLVLAAFFAFSMCQMCSVTSNGQVYNLAGLTLKEGSRAYHFYDSATSRTWYFNVCGFLENMLDKDGNPLRCSPNAVACFTTDGTHFTSTGAWDWSLLLDVFETEETLALQLGRAAKCEVNGKYLPYETMMLFECDPFATSLVTESIDEEFQCVPTISIRTSAACPMTLLLNDVLDQEAETISSFFGVSVNYLYVALLVAVAIFICCYVLMCALIYDRYRSKKRLSENAKTGELALRSEVSEISHFANLPVHPYHYGSYPITTEMGAVVFPQPQVDVLPYDNKQIQSDAALARKLQDNFN